MYGVGKFPDHVTRYTHRNDSRWLMPPREPRPSPLETLRSLGYVILYGACCAGLILSAVIIMQGVHY